MKQANHYRQTLRSSLARRLIIAIVLFSSAITLALTALQLYAEYHYQVEGLKANLQQTEKVHLKSLTQALWATHVKELTLQLEGLTQVPNLEYAAVYEGEQLWAQAGKRVSTRVIEHRYPMIYVRNGKPREIGTLMVVASLDNVYQYVLTRAAVILLSNALKTFLVAGFIFVFFHWLVTRHVQAVAEQARSEHAGDIALKRTPHEGRRDELDDLVAALNAMRAKLTASLAHLREREQQLSTITDNLPGLVSRVDRNLRYLFVNAQYERWFGLPLSAIVGRRVPEVIGAEAFARFEPYVRRALAGERVSFESWIKIASGEKVYGRATYVPDVGPEGEIRGHFTLVTDISESRHAEQALRESEERLRLALDAAHMGTFDWDVPNNRITWSRWHEELWGFKPGEFGGTYEAFSERVHPEDLPGINAEVARCIAAREPFVREFRVVWPDGSIHWIAARGEFVFGADGQPLRMRGAVVEVTTRKRAETMLKERDELLTETGRLAKIGGWQFDPHTLKGTWTDEVARIHDMDPGEETSAGIGLSFYHGEHRRAIEQAVKDAIETGKPYDLELEMVTVKGTHKWVRTIGRAIKEGNKIVKVQGSFQDITERKHATDRLNYLAHHDDLTGLPNRTLFHDRLQRAMIDAERHERLVAVVFVDLDRFKNVNDTLGHDAGDQLLKGVTERLLGAVRRGDTVARMSGDEFTVVLADMAHVDDAARVAQKILDVFMQPFHIAGRDLFMGASLGITVFPFDTRDAGELLRNADIAMYRAKEAGRNVYQFYAAEMTTKATEAMVLENELRHGLERGEFLLHYQPIVDSGGNILGAEALLRWQHGQRGLVTPEQFISLAEETGLILPIGDWVLRQACTQARVWRRPNGVSFHMSVNVSPRQFRHRGLARMVEEILRETGLEPNALNIEITESVLMQRETLTQELFSQLSGRGVSFSIDDFGTGYSSLSYLKRFPINYLKIDQSFVRDVTTDANDAALVQAIISMAHSLGIQTIAEGVETWEQRAFLLEHDCDAMQGYYFSRPVPPAEFTALLATGKPLLGNAGSGSP